MPDVFARLLRARPSSTAGAVLGLLGLVASLLSVPAAAPAQTSPDGTSPGLPFVRRAAVVSERIIAGDLVPIISDWTTPVAGERVRMIVCSSPQLSGTDCAERRVAVGAPTTETPTIAYAPTGAKRLGDRAAHIFICGAESGCSTPWSTRFTVEPVASGTRARAVNNRPVVRVFPAPMSVWRDLNEHSWRKPAWRDLSGRRRPYSRGVHGGMDFGGTVGDPLVATCAGVADRWPYPGKWKGWGPAYGNQVRIRCHNGGWGVLYAHMDKIAVRQGQWVRAGQLVGTLGNSGTNTTGPHLHFELHRSWRNWWSIADPTQAVLGMQRSARIDTCGSTSFVQCIVQAARASAP